MDDRSPFAASDRQRPHSDQPDRICYSDEQIRQIRGVRSALKEIVERCGEHVCASLAVLILPGKDITARFDSGSYPLLTAGKLVHSLHRQVAAWPAVMSCDSVADEITLSGSGAHHVVPVTPDGETLTGVFVVIAANAAPDFTIQDKALIERVADNVARIVDARFDRLTGLMNRREFEYRLGRSLRRNNVRSVNHCVLHLNLDNLKSVSESFGHATGEETIRQVAETLKNELSDDGAIARIGDDEFGVLVRDCPVDRGWVIGQELRRAIRAMSILVDHPIKLTASIGVAQLAGPETIESAMAAAKIACVVAKDRGRDRVVLYQHNDAVMLNAEARMQGVKNLQQALRDDRFLLFCQPIEPLAAGEERRNFEILLRGINDDGSPMSPAEFMPQAEHSRLMPAIDRWVVTHSLERLADIRPHLDADFGHFAINLSGQSLCDDSFLDFVIDELARTRVRTGLICFEVTETTAILNFTRATEFMNSLRAQGCQFSLDDFGSGLSSFSYLKNLPIDYLKIDGQFVREIAEDPVSNAMVAAINQMSHAMGLKTVAEYVENQAIRTQLAGIGVDFGQGFGIARPHPLKDQLQLISKVRPIRSNAWR